MPFARVEPINPNAPSFPDFMVARVGPNYCIAKRTTPRLIAKYGVVISPKRHAELEEEWERLAYGAPLKSLEEAGPVMLIALKRALAEDVVSTPLHVFISGTIAKAEGRASS